MGYGRIGSGGVADLAAFHIKGSTQARGSGVVWGRSPGCGLTIKCHQAHPGIELVNRELRRESTPKSSPPIILLLEQPFLHLSSVVNPTLLP